MTNSSNSIADMMSVSDVKKILAEGGDKTEECSEMVTLFNKQLKKDGDVTYLSLVVPDEDSVHFYIDALVEVGDDPANQIAYGSDICTLMLQILMILLTWRNILPYGTSISRIRCGSSACDPDNSLAIITRAFR